MNSIQHLFRQQAVDKQTNIDSWHSENQSFAPFANGSSNSTASPTHSMNGSTPPPWNQGTVVYMGNRIVIQPKCFADRILNQLHNMSLSSSPQPVPSQAKSPSQEFSSLGSNHSSSGRWKRSSPDPNKMMMGRSPVIMDNNAKRILSTTPSRRASNHVERVGSPSLSGYPVRLIIQCHLEAKDWKISGCPLKSLHRLHNPEDPTKNTERFIPDIFSFRAFDADHLTVTHRRSTTDTFRTISTTFTSTKPTINILRTLVPIKTTTATISSPSLQRRSVIRFSVTIR